jgi:hypothetical protein
VIEDDSERLWKRATELESENYNLKAAAAEAYEDYGVLQLANSSLLSEHNDAHWRCEDLENDLKKANADSTARISALEATVKSVEARSVAVAATSNKRLSHFEAELMKDLTELREFSYIRCIGGLCSLMPEGDPSAMDYIRWLSVEVADHPKVFAGVNENFISTAVEGTLTMAGDSVDLDAVQDVVAANSVDILPRRQM